MKWTAESLARAFHESYASVSPKFFGTVSRAPDWDSISEQSRDHLIAVCADVLGTPIEMPVRGITLEPVPTRTEFEQAREIAVEEEAMEDGLSDWESELRHDIAAIDARTIRRARTVVKAEFET